MNPKKIAIVAEWLTWRGGGETVLDALLAAFPSADLYTTVYNAKKLPEYQKFHPRTSFLQHIPLINQKHQLVPPLLLKAIESLDLEGHDLIISLSSAIGKGIKKPASAIHVCYCHTPMRYVWQPNIDKRLVRLPMGKLFLNYLKQWDLETNKSVDFFITNSSNTAERVKRFYSRDSDVIYPPVVVQKPLELQREDYYLCLSRLIPYKRFDLAIEAFNRLGYKLIVAGDGPERKKLESLAKSNIKFIGRVTNEKKNQLLAQAQALIFPAEEDFGIVPIEAMSQGTPVIAYGQGGAKETVIDRKTGLLFDEQSAPSIVNAVKEFEKIDFDKTELIKQANQYSWDRFQKNIKQFVKNI